jgi:hypothetical protein
MILTAIEGVQYDDSKGAVCIFCVTSVRAFAVRNAQAQKLSLCYSIMLPGQKSVFRARFRLDSKRGKNKNLISGRPKAGRRADFEAFPNRIGRKTRKTDFRPGSTIA